MSKFYKLKTPINGERSGRNFIINLDKVCEFSLMFGDCRECKDNHKVYWLRFRYDTFSTLTICGCQNSSTDDLFTDYINICRELGVNTNVGELDDSFYAQDCIRVIKEGIEAAFKLKRKGRINNEIRNNK